MISIILPARNEQFLARTIEEIFAKAKGDIEVIAVLDNYWPEPSLADDKRLIIIHKGYATGMRPSINMAASIAKGKYIMKLDAHCALDEGFDVKLASDCEYDWVSVPRRYSLDYENWKIDRHRPHRDHLYICPDKKSDREYTYGFYGKDWRQRDKDKKDILIDDLMTFQGSCWFMHKDYFWDFDGLDLAYGQFFHEAQEIGFRTWLSGGRVIRNKNTWYAHLHKGKKFGRGYAMGKHTRLQGGTHLKETWVDGNNGPKQIHPLSWLIEKFSPVPEWEKEDYERFGVHTKQISA